MKILVTGATGFLGMHLCKALLKKGHIVYGTTRINSKENIKEITLSDKNKFSESFKVISIDLTNKNMIKKFPDKIDVIFHTAAQLPGTDENFEKYMKNNVYVTKNLLEYALKAKAKIFVHSSTCSVYGNSDEIVKEETKEGALSLYGLTKYYADCLIRMYSENYKLKSTIIRYSIIYSPKEKRSIISRFFNSIKNGEEIVLNEKIAEKNRNAIHIKDAIDINIKIMEKNANLPIYSLFLAGSDGSIKIIDIIKHIKKITRSKSNIKLTTKRFYETSNSIIDISKAKNILGFNPVGIIKGIELYSKEYESKKR